jgi:hypothetical protein
VEAPGYDHADPNADQEKPTVRWEGDQQNSHNRHRNYQGAGSFETLQEAKHGTSILAGLGGKKKPAVCGGLLRISGSYW